VAEIVNLYLNTLELQKFPQDETELKKAYHRVIFEWHPDRNNNDEEKKLLANRKAQQITEAYEYLSEILENYKDKRSNQDDINVEEYKNYQTRHTYKNQEYTVGFPEPDFF